MALVFISHSSFDNEKTETILKVLKKNNIDSIFLDLNDIGTGEVWEKKIYSEIQRSHVMLLLLSPAWVSSKWCFAEYRLARALGKEILPLVIEDGKDAEIDTWIENNIQKSNFTKDEKVLNGVITRIKNISMDTQKGFVWNSNRSPYPGLVSFTEEDASIFFGRERDVKIIIERLNAMQHNKNIKLINIVSASGLGKSSVLQAGIIPRLKLSYANQWEVLEVFRPTRKPLYEFTKLVSKLLNKKDEYKALYEGLKGSFYKKFLDDIFTEIEFLSINKKFILLAIDQIEEFYTLSEEEERKLFFRLLDYVLEEKENICVIWTLRSDYLKEFQVDVFTSTIHKYEELYNLSVIPKEAIETIIKEPAYIAGVNIEKSLLMRIKDDMQSTDALPILALCLNELYIQYAKNGILRLIDYQHLGESEHSNPMENIIKRKADEAIFPYRNNKETLDALKKAFIPHLVRINTQNEYVQRDALFSSLPKEACSAIEALVNARLLIKKTTNNQIRIEISHEALIRKWSLLQEWLKDEDEFLIIKSRLEIAVEEWEKAKNIDEALLSGLQLEKALIWKDRLSNIREITYINKSLAFEVDNKRRNKQKFKIAFIFIVLLLFVSLYNWKKATEYSKETDKTLEESKIKQALVYRDYLNEPLKAKLIFGKLLNENHHSQRLKILYNSINKELKLVKIKEHNDSYNGVVISRKYSNQILVWTLNNQVELWNSKTRTQICAYEHNKSINGAIFNKEENFILSWSADGEIKLFDKVNRRMGKTFKRKGNVMGAKFDRNETKILSWAEKNVKVWNLKNDKKVLKTFYHHNHVKGAIFSENNKYIFTWSGKSIKRWNIKNGDFIEFKHDNIVEGIMLNKKENTILSWGSNTVRLWSLETKKELRLFRHTNIVNGAIFNEDENKILSWSKDESVRLWSISKNKEIHIYKHKTIVVGAEFYNDEKEILSWGGDEGTQRGEVKLWNTKTAETLLSVIHDSKVYLAVLDIKNNILKSWSSNWDTKISEVREWKIKMGSKVDRGDNEVLKIHNNNKLLEWKHSRELKVYSENSILLHTLKHYLNINGAIFNQDKTKILTWSKDSTIKLWSYETGELFMILNHGNSVKGALFNNDESLIISWSRTEVKLWDMNRNMLCSLSKKSLKNVSFNEEEDSILMLTKDNEVSIYNLYKNKESNNKDYLLEVARENGISLTTLDEVNVLNDKEWRIKKEKARSLE